MNASGGVVDVSDPRTCVPYASRAAEGEADPTSPMEEDDDVSTAALLGAPGGSDDDSDDYDPSASKVCALLLAPTAPNATRITHPWGHLASVRAASHLYLRSSSSR